MSFIESYKRLDNLCKDLFMSETGVSTYICNMENLMYNHFLITNWDDDYKKLKHYLYIRNQIVHDNNVNERTICDENDLQWIQNFYQRILNRTDPLALHQKALIASQQQTSKPKNTKTQPPVLNNQNSNKSKKTLWEKISSLFRREN